MEIPTVLNIIKIIYDIAEKTVSNYKEKSDSEKEKIRDESIRLLALSYKLIDDFIETFDLLVETLDYLHQGKGTWSEKNVKISQTNRKLYEIASNMRLVTLSVANRFPDIDKRKVQAITDACLQIVLMENYLIVEVVQKRNYDLLPIDVEPKNFTEVYRRLYHYTAIPDDIQESKPVDIEKYNQLLLKLHRCKDDLQAAVQELSNKPK